MSSSQRALGVDELVGDAVATSGAAIGRAARGGAANASPCDGAGEACISQPNHASSPDPVLSLMKPRHLMLSTRTILRTLVAATIIAMAPSSAIGQAAPAFPGVE